MKKSKPDKSTAPVAQVSLESLATITGGEEAVATSNMMKSMHDMQMTPVRNLRG